jgi:hypothetical protein
MKILKYVIGDSNIPIFFDSLIGHKKVLSNVVSAGFVAVNYNFEKNQFTAKCFGYSTSLDIGIRDGDDQLIISFLNGLL